MNNEPRTWIQWFLWHIAVTKRLDMNDIERELVAEFGKLYEDEGYFSNAKMTGISFIFGFSDKVEPHLRVGRMRKNGMLSVDVALKSEMWEHATTEELKHEMRLMMLKAVVKAGSRYKLPVGVFEARLRKAPTKSGFARSSTKV